jgi:non-ribosomal peptide synthetase component F
VVFGAVVSGRPPEIEAIENMVGLFINTIPVRVKIERSDDFLELLHQVHRSAVRSKPYEYVPLADIQARSSLKGNLIDHIIAFENYPLHEEMKKAGGEQGPGFTIESLEAADHTNYNFHICIGPGERFRVRVCFNAVIYNRRFIEKVVTHFQEVIRQVTAHDAVPLEDIKITHDYVSAGADMLLEDQEDWLLE